MNEVEQSVYDFIRSNGGIYKGPDIVDGMRHRIDSAIVSLVNRGILTVALDWTLKVVDAKGEK